MGSPNDEPGRHFDEILHNVLLSKGFYMQKGCVTVGQWRAFVEQTKYRTEAEINGGTWGLVRKHNWKLQWILPRFDWQIVKDCYWDNPGFHQSEDHPVTCVSWNDAQRYIQWKNEVRNNCFRLPTEAEWEYACRAGTSTAFSFGNNVSSWQLNCSDGFNGLSKRYKILRFLHQNQRTAQSESYLPNRFGLYNMHGNVWEWCLDQSESKSIIPETFIDNIKDPICTKGDNRILRGGSWGYPARFARSAYRRVLPPDFSACAIGFRLVCSK